jgi:hypothetical protein
MPDKDRLLREQEMHENVTRMHHTWEAERGALATVRRFNAILSAKRRAWFWPKVGAALVSKHHWLVIACDTCGTVVDLDLRVKPRDPEASIRVAPARRGLSALQWHAAAHRRAGGTTLDLRN